MFGLPMYEDVPTVNTGKHSSMFEDRKKKCLRGFKSVSMTLSFDIPFR